MINSPFITPEAPITPRQYDYLRSLLTRKAQLQQIDADEAAKKIDAYLAPLTKAKATRAIDAAKTAVHTLEAQARATAGEPADDLEGFWELPDGTIAKVQMAVHGSGHLYAKRLDHDTGSFTYVSGLIREVRDTGTKLTLDRAKELGRLYGVCIRCGATLTDENSIEAGIGPICAAKW